MYCKFLGGIKTKSDRLLCIGTDAGFDMLKQRDLSTRWTVKCFNGSFVNHAFPSLHGGSI